MARPSRHPYFGRYHWLWYLRRVPDVVFAGRLHRSVAYDRALAEAMAFASSPTGGAQHANDRDVSFPVTQREVAAIAWLIGYCTLVADLHASYRRCGKGAALILDASQLIGPGQRPTDCDPETAAAIDLYDRRLETSGTEAFFGADVVREAPASFAESPGEQLRLFARVPNEELTDVHVGTGTAWSFRYVPRGLIIDDLEALLADHRVEATPVWAQEITDTLSIIALGGVVTDVNLEPESALVNLQTVTRTGYVVIHGDVIRGTWAEPYRTAITRLQHRFPSWSRHLDTDVSALLERVMAMPSAVWPLKGKALAFSATPGCIGIDLAGASSRFLSGLRFPAGDGAVAKARADMFERRVQARINASTWCPPGELAALRGKHLRWRGAQIGEIDALAVNGDDCVVVSCKSKLYTDGHETGDHKAVREAAERVTRAISELDHFVERLRATPHGDNYDFRGIRMHGVVVTPHLFFIRPPDVDRLTLPGLRTYSTLAELQQWLDGHP